MTTQTDSNEMPMWQVFAWIIGFVVAVDTISFFYALNTGWRYPFMLCAIVNMLIVFAVNLAGITWLIIRRR